MTGEKEKKRGKGGERKKIGFLDHVKNMSWGGGGGYVKKKKRPSWKEKERGEEKVFLDPIWREKKMHKREVLIYNFIEGKGGLVSIISIVMKGKKATRLTRKGRGKVLFCKFSGPRKGERRGGRPRPSWTYTSKRKKRTESRGGCRKKRGEKREGKFSVRNGTFVYGRGGGGQS